MPISNEEVSENVARMAENVEALEKRVLDQFKKAEYEPESLISLGSQYQVDFNVLHESNLKYFIHNNQVLICMAHTPMHERAIGLVTCSIIEARMQIESPSRLMLYGNEGWPIQNDLGCHSFSRKIPDFSLGPSDPSRQGILGPTLVLEIAVKNEPFWLLLLEGRAWIQTAGVEFVILVKIFPPPSSRRLRIMILEKTRVPLRASVSFESKDDTENCLEAPRGIENRSSQEVADLFGVKIVFDADCIRGCPLPDLSFKFPVWKLSRDRDYQSFLPVSFEPLVHFVLTSHENLFFVR